MKSNKLILLFAALFLFSLSALVSCEDDSATENQLPGDYVSLMQITQPIEVPEGETKTIEGKVYASQAVGVDRIVNLQVVYTSADPDEMAVPRTTIDPADLSVPATAVIPAGSTVGTFQFTVTDNDLGYAGKQLVISIVPSEGINTMASEHSTPGNPAYEIHYDRAVIAVRRLCDLNKATIQIFTDAYGSETTWELYDQNGTIIEEGGPYADEAGSGETRLLCLPSGDYTFVAYDLYGDGMFDGNNQGYYRIARFDADGNEIQIAQNGTFTDSDVVPFTIP
ncbi:hypothetical protein VF12_38530 [Nostoc linckia z15]|nr:hypothetical protein VF12_38530 [Nostoc linckia z15]